MGGCRVVRPAVRVAHWLGNGPGRRVSCAGLPPHDRSSLCGLRSLHFMVFGRERAGSHRADRGHRSTAAAGSFQDHRDAVGQSPGHGFPRGTATDRETAEAAPAEARLTSEELTGIYEAMLTLEAALPETHALLDGAEHTWVPEAGVLAEEVLRRCNDECLHLRELAIELTAAEGLRWRGSSSN